MDNLNKLQIIAEIGVNHNGKVFIAKKLIDVAAEAGATAVKFQTYVTDNFVLKKTKKVKYQVNNSKKSEKNRRGFTVQFKDKNSAYDKELLKNYEEKLSHQMKLRNQI